MGSSNNLSLKDALLYVFFTCLCLTIIPAFELSAAEKNDTSDKTGTNASYTSDTIEKMVVEDKGSGVIANKKKVTGGKTTEPTPAKVKVTDPVDTKVHSSGGGGATKIGAPPKSDTKFDPYKNIESTPEAIEANSRRIRKGIESDPNKTIFTNKKTDIVELANPGKTVEKTTPLSDQKKGWYKTESQTKTGEIKKKDVYHPGSTDAKTTEKLKELVKDTGIKKRADKINSQTPTKKHADIPPTAPKNLSGGQSSATGDIPQIKQQKIRSEVPGSGGTVKTKVPGQDIVPSTGKPKANTNIPSGKKTKIIGGVGDVFDVLEIGAKGVNNYAKTKGESIDKGNVNLTGDEILKVTRDTMPGISDYEKSYEASKAFQEKRRLESVRRQETITRLENKKNLTPDEKAELSKAEIWKEYNQEDVAGSLERRKKQNQLTKKLSDGSITPEQIEELERLDNEELKQRMRDAKNDAAAAVNNVAEGYEADMMERFNAEKEKARKEGREFREKPDFYNDALPMAGEMVKDAMHAINPMNQIHTSLTEAEIESSTHDERRAWATMKDKMTTKLNSQASEIDKRTLANNSKLSQLLSGQDLTDPEVQDSINTLLDEMKQDRKRLDKLNAMADNKLQEVDPEKLKTLRGLEGAIPDISSLEDWSNSLINKQVEERDKEQNWGEDLVERGEELLNDLRNAEHQESSENPQRYISSNTDSNNNAPIPTIPTTPTWQPSTTNIIANERTNSANAANAENQLQNQTQQQAAAYQAQQTVNQHQTAESLSQIEREQSTQLLDAIIGGATSGMAQGVGAFGERVGQGLGVKASQSITGHSYDSGEKNHSSGTSVTANSPPPKHPSSKETATTSKPPTTKKKPPQIAAATNSKPPPKKKKPPAKTKKPPKKKQCPPGTVRSPTTGLCVRPGWQKPSKQVQPRPSKKMGDAVRKGAW